MKVQSFGCSSSKTVVAAVFLSLLSLVQCSSHHHKHDNNNNDVKESWYTRYPSYPEYCSTTDQMSRRSIPPFPEDDIRIGETRLLHVSAIQRHGARTPWVHPGEPFPTCWKGYQGDVWNCSLTTFTSAPPAENMPHASLMFSKHYDANPSSNVFNGTCQRGQLIQQGYEQVYTSGRYLRDAYVYNAHTKQDHSLRMRLIDTTPSGVEPWDESNIYFRSDDMPRTIMSGEVLLQAMLQEEIATFYSINSNKKIMPEMNVHLADFENDIITMNEHVCPRMTAVKQQLQQSDEFQALQNSTNARKLQWFLRNELNTTLDDLWKCLMPSICTDRDLPKAIVQSGLDFPTEDEEQQQEASNNNSPKYGSNIMQRLLSFQAEQQFLLNSLNDAEYSKLGMGPLWKEILQDNIAPIFHGQHAFPKAKLALYSGHDSTLMPLLASIGAWKNGTLPTYAGLVLLELHELIDGQADRTIFKSNNAFRLIYNGQVITHRIQGCPSDCQVCDLQILMALLEPFATPDRNCQWNNNNPQGESHNNNNNNNNSPTGTHVDESNGNDMTEGLDVSLGDDSFNGDNNNNNMIHYPSLSITNPDNIWTILISTLSGMIIGSFLTFLWFRGFCCRRRNAALAAATLSCDENDGIMLTTTPFSDDVDETQKDDISL